MLKTIGGHGNPAAFFLFEQNRNFAVSPDKCVWIQGQENSGELLLAALMECLKHGMFFGLNVVFSDYLTNLKGFPSGPLLQLDLPFDSDPENPEKTPSAFYRVNNKRRLRVENIGIDDSRVAADGGNFFSGEKEGGIVVSPLCGVALAKSLNHVVVAYRGDNLFQDESVRFLTAMRRRIDLMQPGWDVEKRNSVLRAKLDSSDLLGPEVTSSTLTRVGGVKFVRTLPTGLHILLWSRPKR